MTSRLNNLLIAKLFLRTRIESLISMNVKRVFKTKFYNFEVLRTYFCNEKKTFYHKLALNTINYEYHYYGNNPNLVITPLTT